MKKHVIVIAAGGTAGHVFPALELAKILEKTAEIIFITDKRGIKYAKNSSIVLPIRRFDFWFFFLAPYLFLKSLWNIRKADCIISFGGYTSIMPFLAGIVLRKKRLIYQLDSHVTRLHRFLVPFAHKILYVFAQTQFNKFDNTICIGMPVRSEFRFSFPINFEKSAEKFNIALIGGSLGSEYWINLLQNASNLINNPEKIKLHIQISAENLAKNAMAQETLAILQKSGIEVETQGFFDTVKLFSNAHLIIARAGANTIAEIATVARPAFLVPWLDAIENHQFTNAKNYSLLSECKFGQNAYDLAQYINFLMESYSNVLHAAQKASLAMLSEGGENASRIIMKIVKQ